MPDFNAGLTFFFEHATQKYGWSETYYASIADLTAGVALMDAFIPLRKAVLHSDASIIAARVSEHGQFGDSRFSALPSVAGTAGGVCIDPTSALLMAYRTADGKKRGRKFFHACNKATFTAALNYDPANALSTQFDDIADHLTTEANKWRLKSNPAPHDGDIFYQINVVNWIRMSAHQVGRPFGQRRGRY